MFACTSKVYMFPLKSNDIFRSDTRSPVFSRKSFVCATYVPLHACFSPFPPLAVRNCKNIRNRSIRCSSGRSCNSNSDRVSKLDYPFVSSSDSVTNISKYLKFTLSNSHFFNSSTTLIRVVYHGNIQSKRKLRKSVISPSFVNSANDDISNKFIVGRD